MTRQRTIRLTREWAQGHKCTLRNGEAEEHYAMFAVNTACETIQVAAMRRKFLEMEEEKK